MASRGDGKDGELWGDYVWERFNPPFPYWGVNWSCQKGENQNVVDRAIEGIWKEQGLQIVASVKWEAWTWMWNKAWGTISFPRLTAE